MLSAVCVKYLRPILSLVAPKIACGSYSILWVNAQVMCGRRIRKFIVVDYGSAQNHSFVIRSKLNYIAVRIFLEERVEAVTGITRL